MILKCKLVFQRDLPCPLVSGETRALLLEAGDSSGTLNGLPDYMASHAMNSEILSSGYTEILRYLTTLHV